MATWTDLVDQVPGQLALAVYNAAQADVMYLRDIDDPRLTNGTGGSVSEGYVGVQDTTTPNQVIGTTAVGSTKRVLVAAETIASAASGRWRCTGCATLVNVQGTVAVGDSLQTSATIGRAQTGASQAFGIALTANASGAGQVRALLSSSQQATTYYQTLAKAGSAATQQPTANFIDGPGIQTTVVNNSGSSRTDITIAALPDYVTAQWFGSD